MAPLSLTEVNFRAWYDIALCLLACFLFLCWPCLLGHWPGQLPDVGAGEAKHSCYATDISILRPQGPIPPGSNPLRLGVGRWDCNIIGGLKKGVVTWYWQQERMLDILLLKTLIYFLDVTFLFFWLIPKGRMEKLYSVKELKQFLINKVMLLLMGVGRLGFHLSSKQLVFTKSETPKLEYTSLESHMTTYNQWMDACVICSLVVMTFDLLLISCASSNLLSRWGEGHYFTRWIYVFPKGIKIWIWLVEVQSWLVMLF